METLTIRVACRLCDRQFIVPAATWLTWPRPCCDDCTDIEPPTKRTDADGWPL